MKNIIIGLVIIAVILFSFHINGLIMAADPPHSASNPTPPAPVYCSSCHSVHNAQSTSLNKYASNATLCLFCHTSGGQAQTKRFDMSMLATPGLNGTSHRWDRTMPATSNPNNAYGLRAAANLSSAGLRGQLTTFGNVITCSVCHNQHSQAGSPWDANSSTTYTSGVTNDRHFQRIDNAYNEMCEDCHYYRSQASGYTNTRTFQGGNYTSHPVVKIFTNAGATPDVSDSTQFNNASREPGSANWSVQTGARFHLNGTSDTNADNNVVVDSTKKIRCLSCHRIHYGESDSKATAVP